MPCPDDAAVLAFSRGELDPGQLAALDGHLDTCDGCRQLVAVLATGSGVPDQEVVPLAAGTRLGRYEIDSMIGRGATGRVYRAQDTELGRDVAIKILVEGPSEHLVAEARTMAKLQHPNVVAIHDVGREGSQVFLAMEHVDGGSLRGWLDGRPDSDQVLAMFASVADGLHAAHEAGLVHGDFKPDNVVVDEKGRPRVADFGLALFADGHGSTSADMGVTRTATPVGTPAYLAPEQWSGGTAGARSDQFSFFVALGEALCGKRPFAGSDMATLRANVEAGRMEFETRLSKRLETLIRRGLATDPDQRHADMATVAGALRRRPTSAWKVAAGVGAAAGAALLLFGLSGGQDEPTRVAVAPKAAALEASVEAPARVESPKVAEQLSTAQRRLDEGDYNQAQDAVHAVLAANPLARSEARAWLLQAAIMGERGDYQGARRAIDVARSVIEKSVDPSELEDDVLHAQGLLALGMGRPSEARILFVTALERALSEEGTPAQEARARVHIGLADKDLYDLDGALAAHREALAIETKLHGEDDPVLSRHHHNIGGVLRSMKRYKEASEHYQRALKIRSTVLGPEHPTTLMTVNSLGLIELEQGRLGEARRFFEQAERGLAKAGDLRRARALTNLGIVAQRRGRFKAAVGHYEEARRLWVEAGGALHPLAVELAENIERVQREAKAPRPNPKPGVPEADAVERPEPSYGASPAWSKQ